MLVQLCPYCQGPTKLLSILSDISVVDYYVCEACTNVSEGPKGAIGVLTRLTIQPASTSALARATPSPL